MSKRLGFSVDCWTIAIVDHPAKKKPVRNFGCWATRRDAEVVLEVIQQEVRRAKRWRVMKK